MICVVEIDQENPAERFWDAVGEAQTSLAKCLLRLRAGEPLLVTASMLAEIQAYPGWDDGPEHARTALIVSKGNI